MKVLVVCPFVPWPLDSGGRIRTTNLLREVRRSEPGVEVELWCVADERDPGPLAEALRAELGAVRLFPRSANGPIEHLARAKVERWFRSRELEGELLARLRDDPPDLVHVDEMSVLRALPRAVPCPLLVHHSKLDVEFHRRVHGNGPAARFDRAKLARLEALAARRAPNHVVCSESDRSILLGRHPKLCVHVVPNGFDERYFEPRDDVVEDAPVLFLGSLDYEPNEDGLEFLVHEVLPLTTRVQRVLVVGRDPSARVRAACGGDVELVGAVEDVRPHLARAAALVVPLRIGGGSRLKIAEALATGTPVVSTSVGAEGLDLDARHLALADDAASFAAALDAVFSDPGAARERARRGRDEVRGRLAWSALAQRLVAAWRAAVRR